MRVERYTPAAHAQWEAFVQGAKNATFLHRRGYMEYHASRFTDHSLLFYHEHKLLALLPANSQGDALYSHQGLTYGGLLLASDIGVAGVIALFTALIDYCRSHAIQQIHYRAVPHIYHALPAEEDLYALTLSGAQLTARSVSSVIDTQHPIPMSTLRRRCISKARKAGVIVAESTHFEPFWQLLSDNLHHRYAAMPVHTIDEITHLQHHFPENIRHYTALLDGEVVAGVVLYFTPRVTHVQYISANDRGKEVGALDHLFATLIAESKTPYFDFGTSTEQGGRYLNNGLVAQKEGFGARAVVYDQYTLSL